MSKIRLISALLITLALFGLGGPASGSTGTVTENGILEWFMSAAYRYNGTYDRVYTVYYASNSILYVNYYDLDSNSMGTPTALISSWGGGDDHSTGSVIVLKYQTGDYASNNGKILIASAEHGGRLRAFRSTNAEDISGFSTYTASALTTWSYAYLYEASNGTIYLFSRFTQSGSCDYKYVTSTDSGATWSAASTLFTSTKNPTGAVYAMFDTNSDNTQLHAIFTMYDNAGRSHDIYHALFKVSDATWYKTDTTTALTLPLDESTSGRVPSVVYQTNEARWGFLWDIKVYGNTPVILSTDFTVTGTFPTWTLSDAVMLYHTWSGSAWATETVGSTGILMGYEGYVTGGVLDGSDSNTVYLTQDDGSNHAQMQKWDKSGTWAKTEDITSGLAGDCFRPVYVKNAASYEFNLIFCYTEDYVSQTDWVSKIYYYSEPVSSYSIGAGCSLRGGSVR